MKLKDFISKTLEEILIGVKEAQDMVASNHVGTVSPFIPEHPKTEVPEHITCFQNIHFEILVCVEEKSGGEGSISVLSALVNGKVKGNSSNNNSEQSKISFAVPVHFSPRMINS